VARTDIPTLQKRLKDKDANVRLGAALALWSLGPEAKTAAPALVETLADTNPLVRIQAARALAAVAPTAKEPLPVLLRALKSKDPFLRGHAALALGALGPQAREAFGMLVLVGGIDGGSGIWMSVAPLDALFRIDARKALALGFSRPVFAPSGL
jgi:HEAT repeat protein